MSMTQTTPSEDRTRTQKHTEDDTEERDLLPVSSPSSPESVVDAKDDNVNVDRIIKEKADESGFPMDRGWAWVIVAACFGMHVLVVGGVKSFGVLFVEFQDKYDVTARELGLVQGMAMTIMMSLGLGANLLAVKFTCRKVVFVGGILSGLGFICSAYIPSFGLLYVTYSVVTGLGFALSYSPCVVMVGCHFKERRSLANGISVSGSGVGSFLLPNLMRWILDKYSLPGCLLLMGGLMLNVCVCAMFFRPLSSYKHKRKETQIPVEETCPMIEKNEHDVKQLDFAEEEMNSDEPCINSKFNVIITPGEIQYNKDGQTQSLKSETSLDNVGIKTVKTLMVPEVESHRVSTGDLGLVTGSLQNISPKDMDKVAARASDRLFCLCCKKKPKKSQPKKGPTLFDWSLLTNPVFMVYAVSCGFANFAYPNIFFMLPAFAESNGQDRTSSALLVSIIGITDLIGRLFYGWFSDLKLFPRRYGFIGCIAISAVLNLAAPALTSFVAMATYATLYGFFAGSYMALVAVMLADALGVEKLSSSYGLTTLAMAVGLLPGPLICGGIKDATNKWDFAFIFCGILALIGSALPLFEPCAQRKLRAQEQRKIKSAVQNAKIV